MPRNRISAQRRTGLKPYIDDGLSSPKFGEPSASGNIGMVVSASSPYLIILPLSHLQTLLPLMMQFNIKSSHII